MKIVHVKIVKLDLQLSYKQSCFSHHGHSPLIGKSFRVRASFIDIVWANFFVFCHNCGK